ncbi:hypothetical protein CM15mP5_1190 [bacterium]|nr:MAG: hypothetical protein CM15mP5_1190 [bacterium]
MGSDDKSNYLSDYDNKSSVEIMVSSISGNWNVVAGYFAACCGTL